MKKAPFSCMMNIWQNNEIIKSIPQEVEYSFVLDSFTVYDGMELYLRKRDPIEFDYKHNRLTVHYVTKGKV